MWEFWSLPEVSTSSVPQTAMILRRSMDFVSGMKMRERYPLSVATMPSAMPVLPDEASMMMWCGLSVPSFSASSTMYLTTLSLSEPDGFHASILSRIVAMPGSEIRRNGINGVLPMRSRTVCMLSLRVSGPEGRDSAGGYTKS